MKITDLIELSIHNLLLHKVRSFLTSLGIIFGVGSVIAMLAISQGAEKQALDQIKAMGVNNIILYSKEPPKVNTKDTGNSRRAVQRYGLTGHDLQKVFEMDNVENVGTALNLRKKILRGIMRLDVKLIACSRNFSDLLNLRMAKGRWFSDVDFYSNEMVCIIGKDARKKIFGFGKTDVIGETIKVGESVFRIIGIVEGTRSDTTLPELGNVNDMIFISQPLAKALYADMPLGEGATRVQLDYDFFIVRVKDLLAIGNTERRIFNYMTKSHEKVKDWDKIVPQSLLNQQAKTQKIFTVVMASIAGISLLVGGVGIMNIMLANIYERRKEIGTSRALGAKRGDVLRQFLVETIFLTSCGGVIGVIVGVGISQLITHYAKWPTIFSNWSIILSLVISSLVGIIFGTYPAVKAAHQNPIDVLRAE